MVDNGLRTIKRLFSLWLLYARMDLGWFIRDTRYCLLNILADLASNLAALAGVFLLAQRFDDIGGMSSNQISFMLGYATTLDGIFLLFFSMCNVGFPSRRVGRGQLDHALIQPLPLWMQLATEGFIPISGSTTLLGGLAITAYTAITLHLAITPGWLLLWGGSLGASVAIMVAWSYLIGSLAFYAPVAAEEVSTTAIGLFNTVKSYPLGGLPRIAQMVLCSVLPVGLSAWFPASVLLGQKPAGFPALLTIWAALGLTALATISFKKGMIHYAKYGSPRYSDRGHRR